ncbi:MAG TPA: urea transporter [Pseudomonas sp.]|uniref:urea transporter n=1 Tax=Pseudomonas sp. TaxID=306 RepID=UPI002C53D436|nr:urea transporter [Pseudomonas sp.]HSX87694.1 urea transporter [Pseudomonas sp.]
MSPLIRCALTHLRALLNGFSQIFLLSHRGCGALVLLAIALGAPELLGGALLGGLSSQLTAQRRGYAQDDIETGLYGYNGILLGLLISLKFAEPILAPLLIIVSAAFSSLLLAPWMRCMRERQWLPAFTLPFIALGWVLLALPLQLQSGTEVEPPPLDGLSVVSAIARGLGQVVFLDQPLAGLCLLLGLLLADKLAACWALLGSACGLGLALHLGWPQHGALAGLHGYNAALAAVAVSQVNRGPWLPLLGIALATLLQPGFAALGLPALTMPFILACWLIGASQRLLLRAAADCAPAIQRGKSLQRPSKTP